MKRLILTMMTASAALFNIDAQTNTNMSQEELYRPAFHFTPKKGWMNDPNGLYYKDGVYHLFFQHYPDGSKWGPMHWGHATSKDLIKWEEQPIALYPDQLGYIFSGSSVVDKNNTSGFGETNNPAVVSIFTYHNPNREKDGKIDVETQGIAYTLDNGKTFTKYNANPVLANPGIRDFRDPKVFWDNKKEQWVMVLAAQDRAHLYSSKDLKSWSFLSEFGKEIGAHGGVWECPDLFPMKIEGSKEEKWVLIININPGGPNGGSAAQYFVGDFDGTTFTMDEFFTHQIQRDKAAWLDWGKDNYASVSFDNVPQGKKVIIGWMSNWEYAQDVPTKAWRSSTTIAREVSLKKNKEGYILKNKPVSQLKNYLSKPINKKLNLQTDNTLLSQKEIDLSKAVLNFDLKKMTDGVYTFTLKNKLGEKVNFGINNTTKELFVDRSQSGKTDFGKNFGMPISTSPLSEKLVNAQMKVILDKTSIEIFLNDGEKVMTEIFFPTEKFSDLQMSTNTKGSTLSINAYQINIK